jgi:hypothetical protein
LISALVGGEWSTSLPGQNVAYKTKQLRTQVNGNFNDIISADENKQKRKYNFR